MVTGNLDILGAVDRQAKIQQNIKLIVDREQNVSAVARALGVHRNDIYYWMNGGNPRLPALIFIIEEWADTLRQQQL